MFAGLPNRKWIIFTGKPDNLQRDRLQQLGGLSWRRRTAGRRGGFASSRTGVGVCQNKRKTSYLSLG